MADRSPPTGQLTAAAMVLVVLLAAALDARAVQPTEVLADPALEARAREIGAQLRCLVCQNQSIDESDADLARDLRVLVRARLKDGDSDRQVIDYVVSRYGDFVLLRPPLKPATYALWFGPAVIVAIGGAVLIFYYRGRKRATARETVPLSDDDERRLARATEEQAR